MFWSIALILTLAYYAFLFLWEAKQQAAKQELKEVTKESLPVFGQSESFSKKHFQKSNTSKEHQSTSSNKKINERITIATDELEEQIELLGSSLLEQQKNQKIQNAEIE